MPRKVFTHSAKNVLIREKLAEIFVSVIVIEKRVSVW